MLKNMFGKEIYKTLGTPVGRAPIHVMKTHTFTGGLSNLLYISITSYLNLCNEY